MTRRRGSFPCGTIVLGLALMPVVFAVAFFGLVLAAEAMGVGSLSQLERAVQDLLVYTGLVSAPATPTPAPVDLDPSPTPFQPLLTETLETSDSPTASPSATTTPSATLTLTHYSDGDTTKDRDGLAHAVTDGDPIGDHRRDRDAHAHADPAADPDGDADAAAADGVEHT